jgi:TRAP-type mannitol/chloroaromatic compound transport system permease small subunit
MNILIWQVIELGRCVGGIIPYVVPAILLISYCLVLLQELLVLLIFLEGLIR